MSISSPSEAPEGSFAKFFRASVFLLVFFSVVFYGAELVARSREEHFRLYFTWEREIPFFPPAYLVYFSVVLLPFLVPVLLRSGERIRIWKKRMTIAIAVAGIIFLLFPAETGYLPAAAGDWFWVSQLTPTLTGRHNLVPSLHVGLMIIVMYSVWPHLAVRGRALLSAWGVALALSTLFTHQHHVLDVVTGVLLGFLVCTRVSA